MKWGNFVLEFVSKFETDFEDGYSAFDLTRNICLKIYLKF